LHGVIEKYVLKSFTKGRFLEKGNAYRREHFFFKNACLFLKNIFPHDT
jgi:hypothetical protein